MGTIPWLPTMLNHRTLTMLLLLAVPIAVRAQPPALPAPEAMTSPYPQVGPPPNNELPPGYRYDEPMPPCGPVLGEPPWAPSPYQSSAWRIGIDFIPTISHVSDQAFGGWANNGAPALRIELGYEGPDAYGTRLQFWGFDNDQQTLAGDVELSASTLYVDFYKRFFIQDAELVLGAGVAGAGLEYDMKAFGDHATLNAGGLSVFGEGFYPFWRFKQTDVGTVGRARLALLSGEWRDHGTGFVDNNNNDLMTVIELAWGMEIRHRFGRLQDHYWYIDVVPEFQRWESSSLPGVFDPGFEGTSINFGLAW